MTSALGCLNDCYAVEAQNNGDSKLQGVSAVRDEACKGVS